MVSVHLDKNSKIEIADSRGIQSDNIIKFGSLCEVFMTQDQLKILNNEIKKALYLYKEEIN